MEFIKVPILEAAERCGLRISGQENRVEIEINCPFCNDRKKRFGLNTDKNQFNCFNCGENGNSLTLYAKLMGVDNKTAYKELTSGKVTRIPHTYNYTAPTKLEREPKPISIRHDVYYDFLQLLGLSKEHRVKLEERGLDSTCIDRNMYRTIPNQKQAGRIVGELSKCHDLLGIPGFYTENGVWKMTLKKGLFIPVCTYEGYIHGMQIRMDIPEESTQKKQIYSEKKKPRKYKLFSSRYKENGTKASSWIHVANWQNTQRVYVTEGALKAGVAAYLDGEACFIGLSGVNSLGGLVPLLNSLGIKKIIEAFDMDMFENDKVLKALYLMRKRLSDAGISSLPYSWDSNFKGIDDYLLSVQNQSIVA